MPTSTVDAIKEKLDIAEVLKAYLQLSPAGKNFKATCPFHREKTPSFMVSPERQSWHCFGCGLGGDMFSFVMRYENIEFGDALRILAEKAGVELRRLNPSEHKLTGLLYDLNDLAKVFFMKQLERSPGAKKYLAERGLIKETIETFELGWAAPEPETLNLYLIKAGFSPDDIVRAGLAFKTERGMQLDRFRGRIMFPIHNHFGKVVGFTGRIAPQFDTGEMGKYVNSPETQIFNKSKLLYGFWQTKNDIREKGSAFLVEGQMDFLMSWQAGIKNAVASSGTALTIDHLRTLRRLADQLVLNFDNDEAGAAAAERAIDLAEASDFQVKVVHLEGVKDAAEMAEKDPAALLGSIEKARPAPEFYFDRYLPRSLERQDRSYLKNVRVVLSKLKAMASPIDRDHWMKELSRRLGLAERILLEEAEKIAPPAPLQNAAAEAGPQEAPAKRPTSRADLLSERLIALALGKNDLGIIGEHANYLTPAYRSLLGILERGERRSSDPAVDELMNLVMLRSEDVPEAELATVKSHLLGEHLKERRRELTATVRRAESAGDSVTLEAALRELNQLQVL